MVMKIGSLVWRSVQAAVLTLGLAPFSAQAGTPVTYTDDGKAVFAVEVPNFWSLRTGGLRVLDSPEGEGLRDVSRVFGLTPDAHPGIWVGLISPHGVSDLQGALDYLKDIGPFLVQDAEVQDRRALTLNGMPARSIKGTGRRNGKAIEFTVLAVDLPRGRVAIAVIVFEAGADAGPVGDINRMLATIQPAR